MPRSNGDSNLDNIFVTPDRSISLPTPVQRQIEPANEIASVTPACAPCGTAADKELPLPVTAAQTSDTPMIPIHIQLMTMEHHLMAQYVQNTQLFIG
jgi:hypothetical protein